MVYASVRQYRDSSASATKCASVAFARWPGDIGPPTLAVSPGVSAPNADAPNSKSPD